jgi:hypothetical protein
MVEPAYGFFQLEYRRTKILQCLRNTIIYRNINGEHISLTLHSLDQPPQVQPEMRFSPQAEPLWCRTIPNLPEAAMEPIATSDFVNYQYDPETW